MSPQTTSWNFRHIEFLIDIAEDCRDISKLSATKLKRYMELSEAGLVQASVEFAGKYAELTEKGKFVLSSLEYDLADYIKGSL